MNQKLMKFSFRWVLLVTVIWIAGCSLGGNATVIHFEEQEASSEKYRTRIIITPEYMRFDDGEDSADFILFDRKQRVIYSTSSTDKRTLVIKWRALNNAEPKDIKNRVETLKDSMPSIDGKSVTHLRLYSNDRQCYDLFAVRNLLPEAVKAMIEFQQTLAVEHADFMLNMPLQTASVCDRVNNVYRPARYLKFGFPVYASDYLGRSRQLMDFKTDKRVDAGLFKLPDGFEQYNTKDIRAR